jgi:hypothetical protein
MVTVKSLLNEPSMKELIVLAGHGGLNKTVKAVSVMDAPDSYKWLRGNEIILTTGFMLGNDVWQIEHLVDSLIKSHCSGLGIKKGRFIHELPSSVIEMAKANDFPIIEIPTHFRWSEIMSVFYKKDYLEVEDITITKTEGKRSPGIETIYHDFVKGILTNKLTEKDFTRLKGIKGFDKVKYRGIIIVYSPKPKEIFDSMKYVFESGRFLNIGSINSYLAVDNTNQRAVVLVEFTPQEKIKLEMWYQLLYEGVEHCGDGSDDSFLAIGSFNTKIENIMKCHEEAEEALRIGRVLWPAHRCFIYPMVSVYKELESSSKHDLHYIKLLSSYNKNESYAAIEILEAFIESGSYAKAAAMFTMHDNTMSYRINRMCDDLQLDLKNHMVRNNLLLQIKCWRLLGQEQ